MMMMSFVLSSLVQFRFKIYSLIVIIIIIIKRNLYSAIMPLGGYRGAEAATEAEMTDCVSCGTLNRTHSLFGDIFFAA